MANVSNSSRKGSQAEDLFDITELEDLSHCTETCLIAETSACGIQRQTVHL